MALRPPNTPVSTAPCTSQQFVLTLTNLRDASQPPASAHSTLGSDVACASAAVQLQNVILFLTSSRNLDLPGAMHSHGAQLTNAMMAASMMTT